MTDTKVPVVLENKAYAHVQYWYYAYALEKFVYPYCCKLFLIRVNQKLQDNLTFC